MSTAHRWSAKPGDQGTHACKQVDCRQPLISLEMANRHRKHDHFEQARRRPRICTRAKCQFTNESYIGVSLHILHEHAPKCKGCGKKFTEMIDLLAHRDGKGKVGGCPSLNAMAQESQESALIPSGDVVGDIGHRKDSMSPLSKAKKTFPAFSYCPPTRNIALVPASAGTVAEPLNSSSSKKRAIQLDPSSTPAPSSAKKWKLDQTTPTPLQKRERESRPHSLQLATASYLPAANPPPVLQQEPACQSQLQPTSSDFSLENAPGTRAMSAPILARKRKAGEATAMPPQKPKREYHPQTLQLAAVSSTPTANSLPVQQEVPSYPGSNDTARSKSLCRECATSAAALCELCYDP